jgi:preprotein translocase subunit SecG
MATVLSILHVVVALALIIIILLQTGRGSDIGAAFGAGASQTVFGSQGSTPFLNKVTVAAAVIFMLTSLLLAFTSGNHKGSVSTIMNSKQSAPAVPKKAPAPAKKEAPKPNGNSKGTDKK